MGGSTWDDDDEHGEDFQEASHDGGTFGMGDVLCCQNTLNDHLIRAPVPATQGQDTDTVLGIQAFCETTKQLHSLSVSSHWSLNDYWMDFHEPLMVENIWAPKMAVSIYFEFKKLKQLGRPVPN